VKLLGNLRQAIACNFDGSTIVGQGFEQGPHAYLWRADEGAVDLGILAQASATPSTGRKRRGW
jgi:hypothetical protein